jgi:hypothetical protein
VKKYGKSELIPKTVGTRHTHNTRQINNIVNINCRTSLYSEYFLPSTVKAWNNLPLPTRNLESLNSFKSLINTKNTKALAHYNTALFPSSFRLTEPKISRFNEIVSGISKSEKKSCCLRVVWCGQSIMIET